MRTAAPPPRPVEIARVVPTPKPPTQPPPPPPPVNIQPIDKVVRVGEGVQKANCIKCEPPEYPTLARTARVTDTVVLSALINKQGQIENLTVVRGHVLLRDATVKAVREWRYKPTLLNGEAVEVQTTISISFVFRQ
jgi:protein TonB